MNKEIRPDGEMQGACGGRGSPFAKASEDKGESLESAAQRRGGARLVAGIIQVGNGSEGQRTGAVGGCLFVVAGI